ncbi:DUF6082 family protein [Actinoplanes sp. NPDC089786]|uniref:DUF6082 family protein n=1 Tax=Actinoplanes sp. NPDC089786 TaxID=3155185 RepID=UPI003440A45A
MHLDWKTLADIGQTYGGASALISAVALSGVAASIAYQVRAVRQQRHQAVRDQQRELLLLLASDPETYAHAFTRERAAMHPSELRRDVYAQMWLQFFSFAYETGHFTESDIRSPEGESLFSTEALRSHWAGHRDGWMSSPNSKARRFAHILDDVYHEVLAADPPPDPEPYSSKGNASDRRHDVGRLARRPEPRPPDAEPSRRMLRGGSACVRARRGRAFASAEGGLPRRASRLSTAGKAAAAHKD